MKTMNRIHLILCNLALLGTTAFAAPLATLGPRPDALPDRDYVGTLVVFTATEQRPDGENTYRYPHTSYQVFRDGHLVRKVDNGNAQLNEIPSRVTLPKGLYTIVAQSETAGTVKLPVAIQTGRTTTIHLERPQDWHPDITDKEQADLVRLPNGQPIGYR